MGVAALTALLGPTNTGKTHRAIERMLDHPTGMMGLPLRLLAREVYDRVTARVGERAVALVTGEEKRIPAAPRYWICTVESMPLDRDVDFLAVDEVQLAAHDQRGHTFTDRLLRARGRMETWLLGAETMRGIIGQLLPTAHIERNPRFSKLSYGGTLSLGALPPRTAVVAFSVAEVYELAERLRQRHGGTAVVLGALSPNTRNAQVAMYQAGEVDYMVATDAVGMGLNMDVDRVVFAALHKFDGSGVRPLELAELAQIAGRAGRWTRDGTFATLRPLPGLEPRAAAAIENHEFAPVRQLWWRNHDLEFSSIEALQASLRARPHHRALRSVARADDSDALDVLARSELVRARARDPERVELLWEVCRIPDFRKLLLDSHVRLLAAVFDQLSGPNARIDTTWMAERIRRLDDSGGDIDTLMNRIAFIRTWTYIVHHERWVHDAARWQEATREIEDRHSDALHRRLTERFVERTARARSTARGKPAEGPFGKLVELIGEVPGDDDASDDAWVQRVVDAVHADFALDDGGRIVHGGRVIAALSRGPDIVHPQVKLVGLDEIGAGARARLARRLAAWSKDAVDELVAPLRAIGAATPSPAARGLLYQLERGLGTIERVDCDAQVRALDEDDRRALASASIVIGRAAVWSRAMVSPAASRLRCALWAAAFDPPHRPVVPAPSAVSVPVDPAIDRSFYVHVGYLVRGPRAIRADVIEHVLTRLGEANLGSLLGCPRAQLPAVLRALDGRTHRRRSRARRGRKPGAA